jgi:prepilin-type N-terminal cleavage/methylation domain-containing protein
MWSSRLLEARAQEVRGFSLLEVLIALLVLTLALTGLAMPVASQVALRRQADTQRLLEEAREALLGFAILHGRLPCPATPTSRGIEAFTAGGSALDGRCERFHDGLLPAATLGLPGLDDAGYARDAWGTGAAGRLRYAVFGNGQVLGGVANPFTRTNGMRAATLLSLGVAPDYLFVCHSGSTATQTDCGPAANQVTRRAALVVFSLGPNAGTPTGPGTDEARNQDATPVFVTRVGGAIGDSKAFDDTLTWSSVAMLASRMMAAGRLP